MIKAKEREEEEKEVGKGVRLRGAGCWIPLGLWLQCALTITKQKKDEPPLWTAVYQDKSVSLWSE